jgi:hypothetical protein
MQDRIIIYRKVESKFFEIVAKFGFTLWKK